MNTLNCYLSIKLVFSFFLIFSCSNYLISQDYAEDTWHKISDFNNIGSANMIAHDVDSDGIKELIYSSDFNNLSIFKILDYTSGGYIDLYTSPIFTDKINWMEIYDLDGDGKYNLYFSIGKSIQIFDFDSKKIIDTIEMPVTIEKFYFLINSSQTFNQILFKNSNYILISDLNGKIQVQRKFETITDFEIGNVLGDSSKQLIVNGVNGYIIELENLSTKWVYYGGFGRSFKVFDIFNTGQSLILGSVSNTIICYDAKLKSPIWQQDLGWYYGEFEVIDINNDKEFELITDYSYNLIKVFSLNTFELVGQFNLQCNLIHKFIYDNFDKDDNFELVYNFGTKDYLHQIVIADLNSQSSEWLSSQPFDGYIMDVFDFTLQGPKQMFIGSRNIDDYARGGGGYVYDAKFKTIISDFIHAGNNTKLEDVKFYQHRNINYILKITPYGFSLKDFDNGNVVAEYNLGFTTFMGGFVKSNQDENLQLFICPNSNQIVFYELKGKNLIESWSPINIFQEIYDIKVGNFDGDQNQEIAILTSGIINVYDIKTHSLDYQVPITNLYARVFGISDIDSDNILDIIYSSQSNNLVIVNSKTLLSNNFPIVDNEVKSIEISNLDSEKGLEIAILTNSKLYIYKNSGILVYSSSLINTGNYYSKEFLFSADIDNDNHKEILAATNLGFFEFKIRENFYDDIQPYVKKIFPERDKVLVPVNINLEVVFSENISLDSINSKIIINDENGKIYDFETDYDSINYLLKINPTPTFPPEKNINITLLNTLTDENHNNLDGNKNGLSEGIIDNFTWKIHTGNGFDTIVPKIEVLNYFPWIFKGMSNRIRVVCSDSSDFAMSGINYFDYQIDTFSDYGNGISILPEDKSIGDINENFSFDISFKEFGIGKHKIFLSARDLMGNWCSKIQIDFDIISEDSTNWSKHGFDDYNTGANPYSELNFPQILKYTFDHSELWHSYKIESSILVQDYLIYLVTENLSSKQELICRDINQGNIVWKKTFLTYYPVSPTSFSNGYLYLIKRGYDYSDLNCYNILTGEEIWSKTFKGLWEFSIGPIVYKDLVYVAEGFNTTEIGVYDAFTGTKKWKQEIFNQKVDFAIPVFFDDTMYIYNSSLKALNAKTGQLIFTINEDKIPYNSSGYLINSSPVIDKKNHLLILTTNKNIHILSLDSRKVILTIKCDNNDFFISNPSLIDNKLYINSNKYISEYDLFSGKLNWKYNISESGYYSYPPTVTKNVLATGNTYNSYIFDRNTHELIKSMDSGFSFIAGKNVLINSTYDAKVKVFIYDSLAIPLSGYLKVNRKIDCKGNNTGQIEAIISGGQKPYTYNWNLPNAKDTSIIGNLLAGKYYLTVSDKMNHTIDLNILLSEPSELKLSANQIPATNNLSNGTAIIFVTGGSPPYNYYWEYSITNNSPMLNNIPPGDYGVKVIDANGCEKYIIITVETKVGTEDQYLSEKIKVFPSVTSDDVMISSDEMISDLNVDIVNSVGQVIGWKHAENFTKMSLSFRNNSVGMYLLRISEGENSMFKKIFIVR